MAWAFALVAMVACCGVPILIVAAGGLASISVVAGRYWLLFAGAAVEPQTVIQFKCEFCGAAILGKPHIEYIDGGRYYFNSDECAKAYRQRLVGKARSVAQ